MTDPAPAAGWYADPHDATRLRWWDGSTWTDHVHPPVVAAPPVEPAGPVAVEEKLLEEYYGDEPEPGLISFGRTWRFGSSSSRDWGPDGRSRRGKATITEVAPGTAASDPRDEAAERARLAASGMTPEQVESSIAGYSKVAAIIEQASSNRFARKAVHLALRKLAFNTAQGGPGDSLDVVFDGRRYRAHGFRDSRD